MFVIESLTWPFNLGAASLTYMYYFLNHPQTRSSFDNVVIAIHTFR